ncbi:MAG: ATP-binding protein [Deltaproteobacteria bacterium]|nr:ATP-binding protein [Deltaproteobacteria bacterium]
MKQRILDVLGRYMSRLHSEMTLRRAIKKVGIDARLEDASAYPRLAAALETSLRLFTTDGEVATAVGELREVLTPEQPVAVKVELRSEADMSLARQVARSLAEKMGARSFAAQKFTTVVSELARNIVQYAGQGEIELSPLTDQMRGLRVCAVDRGPGIANLSEVLAGTYKSRTGLGKGILGVKSLMDEFQIVSDESGTRVEAELHL